MKHYVILSCVVLLVSCNGSGGNFGGNNPGGPTPPVAIRTETVVAGANFPVSLVFAPDGRLFYTELQTGNVRIVQNPTTPTPQLLAMPFATVPVATTGEQGLLGLALDPNFAVNHFVYIDPVHCNRRSDFYATRVACHPEQSPPKADAARDLRGWFVLSSEF